MRLRTLAIVAACCAATATVPGTALAAARPQVAMCNWSLAIWPGHDSAGPTVNVSGTIQPSCGGPWIAPYLVLYRVGPGGNLVYVASGMGSAAYECHGTAYNEYEMGGQIPDVTYTLYADCG